MGTVGDGSAGAPDEFDEFIMPEEEDRPECWHVPAGATMLLLAVGYDGTLDIRADTADTVEVIRMLREVTDKYEAVYREWVAAGTAKLEGGGR